ncbi:hypothetical protein D3C78_707860 [compost metagenome]
MNSQCSDRLFCLSRRTSRLSGSSISASRPCGRRAATSCGRCWSVWVRLATWVTSAMPMRCNSSLSGLLWSITWCAPRSRTQSWVSAREAVPITVIPVSWLASWVRIEPTPPAAPTINRLCAALAWPSAICRRSNSSSQAVMLVSGRAAAWAKSRLDGMCPTMRSSTSCSSALLPWRVRSPAYQTLSPGRNRLTSLPTARTTPAASQPSTLYSPADGSARWRTLVSTGFTEMARTSTSRSCGPGVGSGSSMSSRASGWSMAWLRVYPTAFMAIPQSMRFIRRISSSARSGWAALTKAWKCGLASCSARAASSRHCSIM